jgi:hypothetical protein
LNRKNANQKPLLPDPKAAVGFSPIGDSGIVAGFRIDPIGEAGDVKTANTIVRGSSRREHFITRKSFI